MTTLSRNSRTTAFLAPISSPLKILPDPGHKVEVTLRTLAEVYLDLNQNLRFDAASEQKKGARRASGAGEAGRAVVSLAESRIGLQDC